MPGVIAVSQSLPVGQVIEDLLLVVECSPAEDWTNQVQYLPYAERRRDGALATSPCAAIVP